LDPAILLRILRKRLVLLLLPVLNAAAITGFLAITIPPQYEATVTLRILPYSAGAPDYGTIAYFEQLANTFSKILTSDLVIDEAVRRLAIEQLPEFDIEVVPQTELMRLSVLDESAVRAQTVANTLAGLLIEQNQASFAADSEGIQPLLRDRLVALESQLNDRISQLADLQNQIPRDNERVADVERAITTLQQNYNLVLNSYNQATLSQMSRANAIRIVEPAQPPTEPVGPGPVRRVVFGSIVGLIGGIVLAFIAESRTPHFFSVQDIQSTLAAPVVAQIPHIRRYYRANVFDGDFFASETFRRMRALVQAGEESPARRIFMVTSAIPGEGKTTVATNFAAALGLSGRRVVLVEADLMSPRFERLFDTTSFAGFTELLRGHVRLSEVLAYSGIKNVSLVFAGSAAADSSDYMTPNRLSTLVDDLLGDFDVVIIDAPAVLASSDALVLAQQVQNVLWVVDMDATDRKSVMRAHDQILRVGATIIGVAVNGMLHKNDLQWIRTPSPKPTKKLISTPNDDLVKDVAGK